MLHRTLFTAGILAASILGLQGCIYANVVQPMSYRSPTPSDVGGAGNLGAHVEGKACAHMVLGLVAWGDGGYAKAVKTAGSLAAAEGVIADVQADSEELNVLGVYQRRCTVVHARVLK
jgi:hypothetical protein